MREWPGSAHEGVQKVQMKQLTLIYFPMSAFFTSLLLLSYRLLYGSQASVKLSVNEMDWNITKHIFMCGFVSGAEACGPVHARIVAGPELQDTRFRTKGVPPYLDVQLP